MGDRQSSRSVEGHGLLFRDSLSPREPRDINQKTSYAGDQYWDTLLVQFTYSITAPTIRFPTAHISCVDA